MVLTQCVPLSFTFSWFRLDLPVRSAVRRHSLLPHIEVVLYLLSQFFSRCPHFSLALRRPPGVLFSFQPTIIRSLAFEDTYEGRGCSDKGKDSAASVLCPSTIIALLLRIGKSPVCSGSALRSGLNTLSSISLLLNCSVPPVEASRPVEEPSGVSCCLRCRCHVSTGKEC